ncbi:hypothetical protein V5O48_007940 [Marasmius crinis-equi]|uniref:MYND-type domain-containing protein n=1 Tax=Marasmius crinis-equi TaxID=585013 RepID=A0ABR3FFE5_9AGAR
MSTMNDALREEPTIRGIPFFAKALSRFPTVSSTLEQIRKLGQPNSSLDISHPDAKTLNAIEVIGALACHMQARGAVTATFIQRNWSGYLSRWVKFLLEKFVLVEPQYGPNTPEGVDVVEHLLIGVPIFLSFPDDKAADCTIAVVGSSPYLLHLVTQVWCKVIDTSHHTWGTWSVLMETVVAGSHPDFTPPQIRDPATPRLYRAADEEVGRMLCRHIMHEARRLPTMDLHELGQFKMFTMITTQPRCFEGEYPTFLHTNLKYSVAAYVEMLRGLLYKRKSLRHASIDSRECTDAFHIAMPTMLGLSEARVHDPYRVGDMLKGGLIEAIFKAYPCFFLQKNMNDPDDGFDRCSVLIIELISKYLVYGSVLRQFLKAMKRIREAPGNLEEKVKTKSRKIWVAWEGAKVKATGFYRLYQNVKETGMCSSEECRTANILPTEELRRLQYLRCAGCYSAIYCSPGCQKAHWMPTHRTRCSKTAKLTQDGSGIAVSFQDFQLWRKWVDLYIARNVDYITTAHRNYVTSVQSISHINGQIKNGTKNPILILNFDQPFVPVPRDCIEFIDNGSLLFHIRQKYPWNGTGLMQRFIDMWGQRTVDASKVLVLAIFPRNDTYPFPFQGLVDFPFTGKETKSIGETNGVPSMPRWKET